MRIGLGGFAVGNPAGLGRASRTLILALLRARPTWELHLYLRQAADLERLRQECDSESAADLERLRLHYPRWPMSALNRVFQEDLDLPASFSQLKLDAYLGLDFTLPAKKVAAREVAMVYDALPFSRPETLSFRARILYRNAMRRCLSRQACLIVTSRFTQEQLAQRFPDARIDTQVVHLALSPRLWQNAQATAVSDHPLQVRGTHAAFCDPGAYLLYVGASGKRKNLDLLVQIFGELVKSGSYGGALVLAGGDGHFTNVPGSRTANTSENLALEAVGLPLPSDTELQVPRIYDLGFVNDSDLSELYRNADLLVNLSVEEGFGYPVLEALAHGTPALVTKGSAMAEISSIGIVQAPLEPQECLDTIRVALDALPQLRQETRAGLESFNQFERLGEEIALALEIN